MSQLSLLTQALLSHQMLALLIQELTCIIKYLYRYHKINIEKRPHAMHESFCVLKLKSFNNFLSLKSPGAVYITFLRVETRNNKIPAATEALYEISLFFCGRVTCIPADKIDFEIPIASPPITIHAGN